MKARQVLSLIAIVVLVLAVTWLGNAYMGKPQASGPAAQESTYARVLRTGAIRCAYQPYAPALTKDPNTGQLSGILYDVMTELGRRLNVKIDWVEEVGYGVIAEGFVADRYDMFCNVVWPTPERSRVGDFTVPLYYSPVDVLVRADDHRFDGDLSKLNDPAIRFAVKDGDISQSFANAAFPKAAQESITQLSDTSQLLDDVVHNKADASINEPSLMIQYLKHNPGTLRDIDADHPLRVSGNTMMIKPDQYQFKVMLDTTLQDLINSGFIDQELKKYPENPELPIAFPYRPGQ